MIGLELFIEPHGPITLAQHEYEQYEARRVTNVRPHCAKCGRYLPKASVRSVYLNVDESEHMGVCATHGRVFVSWPEL